MTENDDTSVQEGSSLRGSAGTLFAAAAALAIGMVGGGVTGVAVGWIAKSDTEVLVPRELTPEELASACAQPDATDPNDPLSAAQGRVAELERGVAEAEGKVRELERKVAEGKAVANELAAARRTVEEQKTALTAAVKEKEELLGKLSAVSTELAAKSEALEQARDEVYSGRWADFLNGAVQEICDRGNRKKLGDCRTVVKQTLGTPARADRFTHCLRSGQAAPALREWEENAKLPPFSEPLDDNQKEVRGWIVIFCDPTLPEVADELPAVPPG